MGGLKTEHTFELNDDHLTWLRAMTEEYALSDEGKAVRIILDYVMEGSDSEDIFTEVRCNHCNDTSNQD